MPTPTLPNDANGAHIQLVRGNGVRVNLTAAAASSNSAIPAGASGFVIVRATDYIWLNFGTSGAVTASAASTSILFAPGEAPVAVPAGTTHVAVLRVGSADAAVQVESVV